MSKTLRVAVYPDGRRFTIARRNGVYWYSTTAGSSHMRYVREAVEALGGCIETVPNPHYRPARQADPLGAILQGFRVC